MASNTSPVNSSIKRKSNKPKSGNIKKRNTKPKPLLPQVSGVHLNSQGELEIVTEDGLVDILGEHWGTEKLVDKLFYCLIRKEAEPQLVSIRCANNEGSYCKSIDLSEQYESSNTLLYRKYIIRAEELAGDYSKDKPSIFVINLVDLSERLQAELIDLQRANSEKTLSYVLHSAVRRIFAMTSLSWFYESVSESREIKVVLQP